MTTLFKWDSKYSVHIDEIDGQHQQLLDIINELHSAMLKGEANELLNKIINELFQYSITHFHTEEEIMSRNQYPQIAAHQEVHKSFIRKVEEFKDDLLSEKIFLSIDIVNYLKDWIVNHIVREDKKYEEYFKSQGII